MEQSPKNVKISQYPKDTQKITAGMAFSLYRSIQKSQSSLLKRIFTRFSPGFFKMLI
jgi:hypothetical protein